MSEMYDDYYQTYPMAPETRQKLDAIVTEHVGEALKEVIYDSEQQKAANKRLGEDLSKANAKIRQLEKDLKTADQRISLRKGYEYLREYFKISPEEMPDMEVTYYIIKAVDNVSRECSSCNGEYKTTVESTFGPVEAKCKDCYAGKQSWSNFRIEPAKINYISMQNISNTWDSPRVKVYLKYDDGEYAVKNASLYRTLYKSPEDAEAALREGEKKIIEIQMPKAA